MAWIFLTLFAALIQSIRTAAQKRIVGRLSPWGATYVRYLFALPLVLVYYIMIVGDQWRTTAFSLQLLAVLALGGLSQIIGTWALIKTFATRNFAVGSAFSKTEAFQAALIGSLLLGIPLSSIGWLAIGISLAGILCLMVPVAALQRASWLTPAAGYGLLSGAAFAVSVLSVYQANKLSQLPPAAAGATSLAIMLPMQVLIVSTWLWMDQRGEFRAVFDNWRAGLFIGACSALGSIGWFTAMSLQNPALVRTLGQIEFLFTLLITWFFFNEVIRRREILGITILMVSIILLVL